ncbi:unnamed protein product, partial [Phaeothamnion confervicola]
PEWFARAIVAQAAALDALSAVGALNALRRAGRTLRAVLHGRAATLPRLYFDALLSLPGGDGAVALGEVIGFYTSQLQLDYGGGGGGGGVKAAALDWYLREALQARASQQLSPHRLDRLAPLLASLTAADVAEVLQPPLERALKKNPDSVLPAVAALVGQLRVDLSPQLGPVFLPPLLRQLRSPREDVRVLALKCAMRLVDRCDGAAAAPPALAAAATELANVLSGKAGSVLAQWYQRHAVLEVMRRMAAQLATLRRTAAASAAAVAVLVPALEKESHEGTRALGLRCLGDWLALGGGGGGGKWPAEAATAFRRGIESASKPVVAAHLAALADLTAGNGGGSATTAGVVAELMPVLIKKAADGAKRTAVLQPEPVFASCIVLEASPAVGKFPWEALLDPASGFYLSAWFSPGAAGPAAAVAVRMVAGVGGDDGGAAASAEAVLAALCRLLGLAAARGAAAAFDVLRPLPAAPCLALVLCALHPAVIVRDAAEAAIGDVLSASASAGRADAAVACLLAAFRRTLRSLAAAGRMANADAMASAAAGDDEGLSATARSGPPPSRLARTLLCALKLTAPSGVLPTALLLSHHPLAAHSKRGGASLWNRVSRRFGSGGAGDAAAAAGLLLDAGIAAGTAAVLLAALRGRDAAETTAALWALPTLAARCGDAGRACMAASVLLPLAEGLPHRELTALSAEDLAIYATPAGTPYGTPVPPPPGPGEESGKPARRGGRAGDDAEWEQQVRREVEANRKAKGGGGDGGGGGGSGGPAGSGRRVGDAALAQLLTEEAAVRARVAALRARATVGLEAAAVTLAAAPALAPAAAEVLLPTLLELLRVELVRREAHGCLRALCDGLDAPLRGEGAAQAAAALTALQLLPPAAAATSSAVAAFLARVSGAVVPEYAEEAPLSAASLWVAMPVLCAVVRHAPHQADCERALRVISDGEGAGGGGGDGEPDEVQRRLLRRMRLSMQEAVLAALERFPRAEPAGDVVLAELCTGPPLSTAEWAPLLGDIGLLSDEAHVRKACLMAAMMAAMEGQPLTGDALLESRLWLARSDEDPENKQLADDLWAERDAPLCSGGGGGGGGSGGGFAPPLLALLSHPKPRVRQAAGGAMAAAVRAHPGAAGGIVDALCALYRSKAPPPRKPKGKKAGSASGGSGGGTAGMNMDEFFAAPVGMEGKEEAFVDGGWVTRSGVARAFEALGATRALDMSSAPTEGNDEADATRRRLFAFVAREGLADYNELVRAQMLTAGTAMAAAYGAGHAAEFLAECDAIMEAPFHGEGAACFDWRREGVVVLMGGAAAHLGEADPRAAAIADTLLGALSTPSEAVQRAVAGCLERLVRRAAVRERGPELLKQLLATCTAGSTYGARRGAAFGLAGVVKGLGIAVLKREGVMAALEEACRGAAFQQRQGALCAFECMCERLGLLFEPYVIVILPLLLRCSSDASLSGRPFSLLLCKQVREAAHDCARAIMANLSAHGVKLVVPAILASLSDPAWRTKQAAIQLLGAMAYCAPRQLAACLPQVVPRLGEAFADTHPKVREAGKKALEDIGSVIRNPEVGRLSMTLMAALSDPAKHTRAALEALLSCEFLHSIDAPSLALLVPVLQRGLRERSADLKRKAALITGNTVTMVSDPKDLAPYLPALLPGLKGAALDPIPDVRATAATALGHMVRGMGEDRIGADLLPWLQDALKADSSTSERSGAAQALAAVLSALGAARAAAGLRELLPLAAHPRAAVREGVLWSLAFMPAALGRDFAPLISVSLPVLLAGLADEAEPVRDVALRAGQALVATHGRAGALQLVPALEGGLFDDNWRIRQSSVQLLGDLLCLLGDTKRVTATGSGGGGEDDEDRSGGAAAAGASGRAGAAVTAALGHQMRNSVLASLYLVRSDTSAVVRQGALQVWKAVVPHTARVLREVLPDLVGHILRLLVS